MFSIEIEIHSGHDSLNLIDDGKDTLNDFDGNLSVTIERTTVVKVWIFSDLFLCYYSSQRSYYGNKKSR